MSYCVFKVWFLLEIKYNIIWAQLGPPQGFFAASSSANPVFPGQVEFLYALEACLACPETIICQDVQVLCSSRKFQVAFFVPSETISTMKPLSVEVMVCTIINQVKQITYQMSEMFGLTKSVQTPVKLPFVTKIERDTN